MKPEYKIMAIPLDGNIPANHSIDFNTAINTSLTFPGNTTFTPEVLTSILRSHPLLSFENEDPFLDAQIIKYSTWTENGHQFDPSSVIKARLKYDARNPTPKVILENLLNYYVTNDDREASFTPKHDSYQDNLTSKDYVDPADVLNTAKSLTKSLQNRLFANIETFKKNYATRFDAYSADFSQWMNSSVALTLLRSISEEKQFESFNASLTRLQLAEWDEVDIAKFVDSVTKIKRRFETEIDIRDLGYLQNGFHALENERSYQISTTDLNVSTHAALLEPLLSKAFGFTTHWHVELIEGAVEQNIDYVILIDETTLHSDLDIVDIDTLYPTVFRNSTHTHPTSFHDIGEQNPSNTGLAFLNDHNLLPRYNAVSINSETYIDKLIFLQSQNSLNGVTSDDYIDRNSVPYFTGEIDDRSPDALANMQYGIPEPESSGVMFSAPSKDLVKPTDWVFANQAQRDAKFPCYFHEDLKIGAKLNIKNSSDGTPLYLSVHKQNQSISLHASNHIISGETEDYFALEQSDDKQYGYTSTELFQYSGLNTAQYEDYQTLTNRESLQPTAVDAAERAKPFSTKVVGYEGATRLLYGQKYDYLLRYTFTGGVSLSEEEIENNTNIAGESYTQKFPFYRSHAYSPGEIVSFESADQAQDEKQRTIHLNKSRRRREVYLVPTPQDVHEARFHGQIFQDKEEPSKLKNRNFVSDIGKYFLKEDIRKLNYFFDTDSDHVMIRAKLLNGGIYDDKADYEYVDSHYCKVVTHDLFSTITKKIGKKGNLKSFAPIKFIFTTTKSKKPKAITRRFQNGYHIIEYRVPEFAVIELSIVPFIDNQSIRDTAWKASSNYELLKQDNFRAMADCLIKPDLAEQKLTIINSGNKPVEIPNIFFDPRYHYANPNSANHSDTFIGVGLRDIDNENAQFKGRVELDAASTANVRLTAAWNDIVDKVSYARYVLEKGNTQTSSRDIVFQKYPQIRPSTDMLFQLLQGQSLLEIEESFSVEGSNFDVLQKFSLQCLENKVYYGSPKNFTDEDDSAQTPEKEHQLNLKDKNRKICRIKAIANPRYGDISALDDIDLEKQISTEFVFDVPNTLVPEPPQISYIMPIVKEIDSTQNKTKSLHRSYGIRVYVKRPCFKTGPCERVAIGCSTVLDIQNNTSNFVSKYHTQWGEDPIERPKLEISKRVPKAADFVSPEPSGTESIELDAVLYPPEVIGGSQAVLYKDNIAVLSSQENEGDTERYVSCASFALQYSETHRLWYFDFSIATDFFGWCGLALYTHQPHSLKHREISPTPTWVYVSMAYDEPIVWHKKNKMLHITIGPVFAPDITYEFNTIEFKNGVSENISPYTNAGRSDTKVMKSYEVDGAQYFEITLPKNNYKWNLVKRKFKHIISSRKIFEN